MALLKSIITFIGTGKRVYLLAVCVGVPLGIGLFVFFTAQGLSYASSKPEVCINCHIMQPRFDSWQKSSHHAVATCVDCHLPHDLIGKYRAKAENGYHHSRAFTAQDFHEPIMIKPGNSRILTNNCIACHQSLVHSSLHPSSNGGDTPDCVHCHADVGHGEAAGLGGPEKNNRSIRKEFYGK